ncbi:MAG: oligosaccharide flippase family protein [Candidatus Aminicenantes bacterium]|nr:oligosaccharide flippase family protein [Candidatus Aminicenantes bacterium]
MQIKNFSIEKRDTIKLTFFISFSVILGRILSMPSGIITAKVLGPSLLGVLAVVNLLTQYAGYTHLGLLQSIPRNVPIAYGRGDLEDVRSTVNTVFTVYFFAGLLSLFVLWILYFSGVRFKGMLDFVLLVIVTLLIVANYANSFLRTYIKGEGKFLLIGKSELIQKMIVPALTIPAVIFYKLKGILFATLVCDAIIIAYYLVSLKRPKFHFYFNLKKTLQLWKIGFIIFVNNISESLFWGVGLLILSAMMSSRHVGLYSFALASLRIVEGFVEGINMTIHRKMMIDGGKYGTQERSHFRKYTEGILASYLLLNSLIIGSAVLFYIVTIKVILTEYIASIPAMIVLAVGYIIYTSRIILTVYLNITEQLQKRLVIILAALGLNAFMAYVFINFGLGIVGVASACSFNFILIAVSILGLSLKQIYGSLRFALLYTARIIWISAVQTGVLYLFYKWTIFDYSAVANFWHKILLGLIELALKGGLFGLICIGLYFFFFRHFDLYRELKPIVHYVWFSVAKKLKIGKKSAWEYKT